MSSSPTATTAFPNKALAPQSLQDLAAALLVTPPTLRAVLYGRRERLQYREFKIAKRNGGERLIHAPPKNLSILQRKLLLFLNDLYAPKPTVFGFVRNRSIRDNAELHVKARILVNIDLKNFFHSINIHRVRGALQSQPFCFGREAAIVAAQIACHDDGFLPQGGRTSPILSNIVCRSLDRDIRTVARRHACWYSRYADDITISTRRSRLPSAIAANMPDGSVVIGHEVRETIEKNGFLINQKKVRIRSIYDRQEVTGLVANERPNVPREYLRETRGLLRLLSKFGKQAVVDTVSHRRPAAAPSDALNSLRGRIAFIRMVRGLQDPLHVNMCDDYAYATNGQALIDDADAFAPHPIMSRRNLPTWAQWTSSFKGAIIELRVGDAEGGDCDQLATAFLLSPTLAITAGHCIEGKHIDRVIHPIDGNGQVLRKWPLFEKNGRDLAALELKAPFPSASNYFQSECRIPEQGESVLALGFRDGVLAFSQDPISVDGTVRRISQRLSETYVIDTDLGIEPGMSGGPVIDRLGRVVGIAIGFTSGGEGDANSNRGVVMPFRYCRRFLRTRG